MKVLVVYHTIYGHIQAMAKAVQEGAQEVGGVEVVLRRVREFPENVEHMEQEKGYSYQVYQSQAAIPECTLDDLRTADGVIFGSPTRYGNMTAQLKALIDSTAQLWLTGAMEGKPAGVFTSTASTHGGQETTLLTMMVPLLHLGMLIVGVPYSLPGMIHTEARGGTPYGATTIAGPQGELQPTPEDHRESAGQTDCGDDVEAARKQGWLSDSRALDCACFGATASSKEQRYCATGE